MKPDMELLRMVVFFVVGMAIGRIVRAIRERNRE